MTVQLRYAEASITYIVTSIAKDDTFDIPFPYLNDDTHLVVDVVDSSGNRTTLELETDYAVDVDDSIIIILESRENISQLVIRRNIPISQNTDFNATTIFAGTTEDALDKLTMILQDRDIENRVIHIPVGDIAAEGGLEMPPLSAGPGYLYRNGAGKIDIGPMEAMVGAVRQPLDEDPDSSFEISAEQRADKIMGFDSDGHVKFLPPYTAGNNITIDEDGTVNGPTYTGDGSTIDVVPTASDPNVKEISCILNAYTAGNNITIDENNVISCDVSNLHVSFLERAWKNRTISAASFDSGPIDIPATFYDINIGIFYANDKYVSKHDSGGTNHDLMASYNGVKWYTVPGHIQERIGGGIYRSIRQMFVCNSKFFVETEAVGGGEDDEYKLCSFTDPEDVSNFSEIMSYSQKTDVTLKNGDIITIADSISKIFYFPDNSAYCFLYQSGIVNINGNNKIDVMSRLFYSRAPNLNYRLKTEDALFYKTNEGYKILVLGLNTANGGSINGLYTCLIPFNSGKTPTVSSIDVLPSFFDVPYHVQWFIDLNTGNLIVVNFYTAQIFYTHDYTNLGVESSWTFVDFPIDISRFGHSDFVLKTDGYTHFLYKTMYGEEEKKNIYIIMYSKNGIDWTDISNNVEIGSLVGETIGIVFSKNKFLFYFQSEEPSVAYTYEGTAQDVMDTMLYERVE